MAEAPQRSIRRPKRWDQPFGPDLTDADIERILAMAPFDGMDRARGSSSGTAEHIARAGATAAKNGVAVSCAGLVPAQAA